MGSFLEFFCLAHHTYRLLLFFLMILAEIVCIVAITIVLCNSIIHADDRLLEDSEKVLFLLSWLIMGETEIVDLRQHVLTL